MTLSLLLKLTFIFYLEKILSKKDGKDNTLPTNSKKPFPKKHLLNHLIYLKYPKSLDHILNISHLLKKCHSNILYPKSMMLTAFSVEDASLPALIQDIKLSNLMATIPYPELSKRIALDVPSATLSAQLKMP